MDTIEQPILGKITQGTLFSGATAEDYPDKQTYGVFITARCDFAHDKTRIFNYLPVVRMEDWVEVNFKEMLLDQAHLAVSNDMKNILRQAGQSGTVLDYHHPTRVMEMLLSDDILRLTGT